MNSSSNDLLELSIVMPCLNEAETLATCVRKARGFLERVGIDGEVIVADNGSTDGSIELAESNGARVVHVARRGYGAALIGGIEASRGRFVIMGDADDSYDFSALDEMLDRLREGYDLVMGNRFAGGIRPGAMPPLHRYLGNPVLTWIGRIFFASPVGDFHCGLRGFCRNSILRLNLQTTGMEFASEMVVKATLFDMKITEVPVTLSPDGRSRPPHLRSWRDGWRHLRFMLLYSPRWLFLFPGLSLMILGLILGVRLAISPIVVGSVRFDVQTLLFAATAFIIGYQAIMFALFAKIFAIDAGLLPRDSRLARLPRLFNLESGLIVGLVLFFAGLAGSIYAVNYWGDVSSFGPLNARYTLRIVIPSVTSMIVGLQTALGSFYLGLLRLGRRSSPELSPYDSR